MVDALEHVDARVRSILSDFGYPKAVVQKLKSTGSGGVEVLADGMTLRVDASGSPREWKIPKVKFERSDASSARVRLTALLRRYPLPLGEGKWVTERSLAPDPYGAASSSMRYFFVPVRYGYPFLRGSLMTTQFSTHALRVFEWSFHPWKVPVCPKPKRVLTRRSALAYMERAAHLYDHGTVVHTLSPQTVVIGWQDPKVPRLIYIGIALSTPVKTRHGTLRLPVGIAIDAQTGKPVTAR